MRFELLPALLAVLLLSAVATAQPYATAHFEIYDQAGAGLAYLQSLGNELESAYTALASRGARLAPPCDGPRYTVYVKSLSTGEGGFVSWEYSYDASGQIVGSCVRYIEVSSKLSGSSLRKTAYHEVVHIAQAAYFTYHSVVQAYPWYVEASAEGVAGGLTGLCTWEVNFYSSSLYSRNPYSYNDGDPESYSYSAFFSWLLSLYSAPEALSRTLSSSTVQNGWLNGEYVSFLLGIVRGQSLCGKTYTPSRQQVFLSSGSWSTTVSLEGLSAAYYAVQLSSTGIVEVRVEGASLISNLKLNEPFEVRNTTLYLALVNPSASSISAKLTVSALPYLSVELAGGSYDASSGVLSVTLKVTFALKPVSGSVTVNGTEYRADNGLVNLSFSGLKWGSYTLVVQYSGYSQSIRVDVPQLVFTPVTRSPVYLSQSGYGSLVIQVVNPSKLSVSAVLILNPPLVNGTEAVRFTTSSFTFSVPPSGSQRLEIQFTAGRLVEGEIRVKLSTISGEILAASFRVVPVELHVAEATHNFASRMTWVRLFVPQLRSFFEVSLTGLAGEAVASYDTYVIGRVQVKLPPLSTASEARPDLVAPSWALLRVRIALNAAGACPEYPLTYSGAVAVNSTSLGTVSFRCGETARAEGSLNATHRNFTTLLVFNSQWVTEVKLHPPRIFAEPKAWLITDRGVNVSVAVSVSGPHAYYTLGKVFRNSTELCTFSAPAGSSAVFVDTGFTEVELPVPDVKITASAPDVVLAPGLISLEAVFESEALIEANVTVRLNGSVVHTSRVSKNSAQPYVLTVHLQPPGPGLYSVEVTSWFANASRLVYYVEAAGVLLRAPAFVLVGRPAKALVEVYARPPLPLPVTLRLENGSERRVTVLHGNSSLVLESDAPSTVLLEARLLNFTSTARVTWDELNLRVKGVVGFQGGLPILPSGPVSGFAVFSNGTRVPAQVLVNGQEVYSPRGPGRCRLNLTVEFMGYSNTTVLEVYFVPAETYFAALELKARLRASGVFEQLLSSAVSTGNWSYVALFVGAYTAARKRADAGDPIGYVALLLLERGAERGDAALAEIADGLVRYELVVYTALITAPVVAALTKVGKRQANR